MKPTRLLLVDDHAIVRKGLAALVSADDRYRVVAEASDGDEAVAQVEATQPDIVILDLHMPRLNGLETIRRLTRQFPRVKIIVLSMYDDEQFVAQSLNDGAKGYVLKQGMDDELFGALQEVVAGGRYVSTAIDLPSVENRQIEKSDLTAREREVLQLIVDGHTTQEIASMLTISPHTATRHRANLMDKLNAHTQMELVRAASQRGLVVLPRPPFKNT